MTTCGWTHTQSRSARRVRQRSPSRQIAFPCRNQDAGHHGDVRYGQGVTYKKKQKQNKWAINHLTKLQCRVDEEQAKIRLFKQEANSPDFLIENSATKVFNPLRCAHEYRRFVHHHEPNGGFPEVSECVLEVIVRQRYLELLA